jgi:hypothetical protein
MIAITSIKSTLEYLVEEVRTLKHQSRLANKDLESQSPNSDKSPNSENKERGSRKILQDMSDRQFKCFRVLFFFFLIKIQ